MVYIPPKKSVWLCERDTEGRKNSCKFRCHNSHQNITNFPKHWFVIISDKNNQDFITALPFTSTPSQANRNNGVSISSNDITSFSKSPNSFNPNRLTLALCNKICRIPREELQENKDYGMVKKDKYNDLVWEIKTVIR
jgi:uncharacterized protein YifN (PemK superfamily)